MGAKKFRVGDVVRVTDKTWEKFIKSEEMTGKILKSFRQAKRFAKVTDDGGRVWTYHARSGKLGRGEMFPFNARELELVSRPTK